MNMTDCGASLGCAVASCKYLLYIEVSFCPTHPNTMHVCYNKNRLEAGKKKYMIFPISIDLVHNDWKTNGSLVLNILRLDTALQHL